MEISRHWRIRQQRYGLSRDWSAELGEMDKEEIDEFLSKLSRTGLTWAQWAQGSVDLVNRLFALQHQKGLVVGVRAQPEQEVVAVE